MTAAAGRAEAQVTVDAGALAALPDEVFAAELVAALNAVRAYDKLFAERSMHLSSQHVSARLCFDRAGKPLLAVRVRRVEPDMHHVVGAQISAIWPGLEYRADVRW